MQSDRVQIPAITGMRGVAILLVLINHFGKRTAPFDWTTAPGWFDRAFAFSGYGMTLFFTLSGFVITYNYLDLDWCRAPGRSAWQFAVHRFSRLYPALLLFIFLVGLWRQNPVDWVKAAIQIAPINTWIPLPFDYSLGSIYNLSWSISTEFGLYLAFSVAMVLLARAQSRQWRIALCALSAGAALCAIYLGARQDLFRALTQLIDTPLPLDERTWRVWFFYMSPHYRMIEFSIGAVAGFCVLRHRMMLIEHRTALRTLATTAAIGLVLVKLHSDRLLWGCCEIGILTEPAIPSVAAAILFAIIMLNSSDDETRINRALGSVMLVFVGTISYSLYLFQILATAAIANPSPGVFSVSLIPKHMLNLVICFGFLFAFSTGSYKLLEAPARRMLRRALLPWPAHRKIPTAVSVPAE
jgi:peptidoglycan/LPS O-acetylase OafA/YrhL